jgi:hypothetical protein
MVKKRRREVCRLRTSADLTDAPMVAAEDRDRAAWSISKPSSAKWPRSRDSKTGFGVVRLKMRKHVSNACGRQPADGGKVDCFCAAVELRVENLVKPSFVSRVAGSP